MPVEKKIKKSIRKPRTSFHINKGICYALFVYDIGHSIDLDESERCISVVIKRHTIKHKRLAPMYFEYDPPPLRIIQEGKPLPVSTFNSNQEVNVVVYDFGAVSVIYSVPFKGDISDFLDLTQQVDNNARLLADSRDRVEQLLTTIKRAVTKPQIADFVEEYAIFQVADATLPGTFRELPEKFGQELAQILRAEKQVLSAEEVQDALSCQIAFGLNDLTLVDWNAAIVFDTDADDSLAALEFANVALLEMRYLDQQLDKALDQAYNLISKRTWKRAWRFSSAGSDLKQVSRLQVDNAILFEAVHNALKLLGDQYLARLYRLASRRFHLDSWDKSIIRKLDTLESIYQKLSDEDSHHRMELLEWIIVILFVISIVLPFFGLPH